MIQQDPGIWFPHSQNYNNRESNARASRYSTFHFIVTSKSDTTQPLPAR